MVSEQLKCWHTFLTVIIPEKTALISRTLITHPHLGQRGLGEKKGYFFSFTPSPFPFLSCSYFPQHYKRLPELYEQVTHQAKSQIRVRLTWTLHRRKNIFTPPNTISVSCPDHQPWPCLIPGCSAQTRGTDWEQQGNADTVYWRLIWDLFKMEEMHLIILSTDGDNHPNCHFEFIFPLVLLLVTVLPSSWHLIL